MNCTVCIPRTLDFCNLHIIIFLRTLNAADVYGRVGIFRHILSSKVSHSGEHHVLVLLPFRKGNVGRKRTLGTLCPA